jgi:hypothetical protein
MNIGDLIPVKFNPAWRTLKAKVTQIFDDGSFVGETSPGHLSRFRPEQIVLADGFVKCKGGCGYWHPPEKMATPALCPECLAYLKSRFGEDIEGRYGGRFS